MTTRRNHQGRVVDERGDELPLDTLPREEEDVLRRLPRWRVELGALPPEEAAIDSARFLAEVKDYARGLFRPRREAQVRFAEAGVLGATSYWVFDCRPEGEAPLYVVLVRDRAVTELAAWEQAVPVVGEGGAAAGQLVLTPAQAALQEFLLGPKENQEEGGE